MTGQVVDLPAGTRRSGEPDLDDATADGAGPHAAPPTRWGEPDSMGILCTYAVLLIVIPSVYVIGPLGGAGTPAAVLGVLALGLWCLRRLVDGPTAPPTAVHWVLYVFVGAMIAALTTGALRPTSTLEFTALWRGTIAVASWVGIALTVMDGLHSRERLVSFLRVVVWLGTGLATLGIAQFLTGIDVVPYMHLSGLVQNGDPSGLGVRSGFPRVSGTALHSIEFSAVLAMILPIAFALALEGGQRRARAWLPVLLIATALPLTVARSGVLGLIVAFAFAFLMARGRQRLWLLLTLPVFAVVLRLAIPGLVGTIKSLFLSADQDISIAGRTSDYGAVSSLLHESPLFGRGLFTFLPSIYRILDNQYLLTLVEAGVVGLTATLLLVVVPTTLALRRARTVRLHEPSTPSAPHGGVAHLLPFGIGASLFSAALLFATFDGFSFPMCMGVFSVMLGASGAVLRLCRPDQDLGHSHTSPERLPSGRLPRNRALAVAAVVAVSLVGGGLLVQGARPLYGATVSFALAVPGSTENIYFTRPENSGMSDLLRYSLLGPGIRSRLIAAGAGDYTVAIGTGSLGPHTDILGYGDLMRIRATGSAPAAAERTVDLVVHEVRSELSDWQAIEGADPSLAVATVNVSPPEISLLPVHRAVGAVGVVALSALLGMGAASVSRLLPGRSCHGRHAR